MRSSAGGIGGLINAYAALESGDFNGPATASTSSARKIPPKVSTGAKTTSTPSSALPAKKPPTSTSTTTFGKKVPAATTTSRGTLQKPNVASVETTSTTTTTTTTELQFLTPEKIQEDYNKTKEFGKQLEALKQSLLDDANGNSQKSKFSQPWLDKDESSALRWMRLSDVAAASCATLQIFPNNRPSDISAGQVQQGSQGDCYLNSVLATLAQNEQQRKIIESLFLVKEVNAECIYAVRLWSCGKWHNIIMDDRFPVIETTVNKKTTVKLLFSSCKTNNNDDDDDNNTIVMWVPLLEKALATFHGSYASLRGGVSMEAFLDLTGAPVRKIRFRNRTTSATENNNNNSSTAVSTDDLAKKMSFYFKTSCVMAASCGGGSARDALATKLGLRPAHSYSVLQMSPITSSSKNPIMILCRDPQGATDFKQLPQQTACSSSSSSSTNAADGSFWIPIDQFMSAFNLLVVCITHSFEQVISGQKSAICTAASSFLPANLAECAIEFIVTEKQGQQQQQQQQQQQHLAASTMMKSSSSSSSSGAINLYAMASQPQIRAESASSTSSSAYHDLCVVILKLPSHQYQSPQTVAVTHSNTSRNLPVVVAMSEVNVDRISFVKCSITDPGYYIAFPISFTQQNLVEQNPKNITPPQLFATLMVEATGNNNNNSSNAATTGSSLRFSAVAPIIAAPPSESHIHATCNKWLFKYIESHPDVEARLAQNNLWDIFKWSHGLLRCSLVRNSATTTTATTSNKSARPSAPSNTSTSSPTTSTSIIEVTTEGSVLTTLPGRDADLISSSSSKNQNNPEHSYSVVLAPKQSCIVHLSVPLPWSDDEGIQINSAIAWKFKTSSATTNNNNDDSQNKLPKMLQPF